MARHCTLLATIACVSIVTSPSADAQSAPEPGQQVALVTGSTSGLGREVATRLGASGTHVIVHGRNRERGMEVVEAIESAGGSARFYAADLASLDQVRRLGEALLNDYDEINLLINNAGIAFATERSVSEDGHELHFQVNYLSHFLLTAMLLPRLRESAPSRIINVSSIAQQAIDFDDVMLEDSFNGGRAYAQSKLAQILHTFDLAEELEGSGVLVNALHPATMMDTPMVLDAGYAARATTDEGADAVMQLVTSTDLGSGGYFNGLRRARANDQAYDLEARARLKRLSEQLTGTR